jgi:hypothetical protein
MSKIKDLTAVIMVPCASRMFVHNTLKMEATSSSAILLSIYETSEQHIPEECNLLNFTFFTFTIPPYIKQLFHISTIK